MRTSGILMHISSLPSKYGIGTMGREAKRFVNFLAEAGQAYWQILPINPTAMGIPRISLFPVLPATPILSIWSFCVRMGF